jgi:hypothetical protein
VDFSGRSKPFTYIYYPQQYLPTERDPSTFYGFYMEAVPFYDFYQPESFYTFYSFSSLEVGKVSYNHYPRSPPFNLYERDGSIDARCTPS